MLINLTFSVDQLAAEIRSEIEILFSELLRASYNGLHMIIVDRSVCGWANEHLNLNNREMAHLERLKEKYSQRGSLISIAPCILDVELGDSHLSENTTHKYRIGHRRLLDGNYLETSRFLIEHIGNDGEFLKLILDETRRRHTISAYSFQSLHGGGADIASCFRTEIPHRHILVTVADSDKVAPCDTLSATMRNVIRESERQTYVGMVCETPCKEIENFIPLSILIEHRRKLCPMHSSFGTLETLIHGQGNISKSDCLWLFFDLKKGIEAAKLDVITARPIVEWLQDKYQLGAARFFDIEIEGFGEAILREFLKCGEAVKDFVSFMKSPYWKLHFEDFFDLIYWYFAAEKRVRVP